METPIRKRGASTALERLFFDEDGLRRELRAGCARRTEAGRWDGEVGFSRGVSLDLLVGRRALQ